MEERTLTILTIVAVIVGASGLGIGTYSMLSFQVVEGPRGVPGADGLDGEDGLPGADGTDGLNGIDGVNGTDGIDGKNGSSIVAVWESISYSAFYLVFGDITYNRSEFFTLTESNTSIALIQAGWYRFSVRVMVYYNGEPTTHDEYLHLEMYKNGQLVEYLEYIDLPLPVTSTDRIYHIKTFVYVFSDGDDVFRIQCWALYGTVSIGTGTVSDQAFNQFTIEYLGEP